MNPAFYSYYELFRWYFTMTVEQERNKKQADQKHVLVDMHLIIHGCDTVKTLEAIFVKGHCIVEYRWPARMELISCSRSVYPRRMNRPIYGSWLVLQMKPGDEILKVVKERFDLSRSSLCCSLCRPRAHSLINEDNVTLWKLITIIMSRDLVEITNL